MIHIRDAINLNVRHMKYKITVHFETSDSNDLLGSYNVQYREALAQYDSLNIYRSMLTIEAKRNKILTAESFKYSTLYRQVSKALWVYYVSTGLPNQIKSIQILKYSHSVYTNDFEIDICNIEQIVKSSSDISKLKLIKISSIGNKALEENDICRLCLNSGIYLLRANETNSNQERFEKLWKSFNALYKAYAKQDTDHECHRLLRNYIIRNSNLFPLSCVYTDRISYDEINGKLMWVKMIHNNFQSIKNADGFADQVLRNTDIRIIKLYNATISVREQYLRHKSRFNDVDSHLQRSLSNPIVNNSDFIATICLRYIYFVRNKYTHGERHDIVFNFIKGDARSEELSWLSDLLEMVCLDMMNLIVSF